MNTTAMDCFNSLLLKLREVHEREVEGWQVKIQELSNKKGCDTKRMEELFTKNQQMKEQQRLLTENIKTLENRLRAGLCDRCTVTQEVAKRRQQEYEAAQMQNLQHITVFAGEMNNLKRENKRLRDEIKIFRAALQDHADHSSNSCSTSEVRPQSSPDLPPLSTPVTLVTMASSKASNQPAMGNVAVKTEIDQRSKESEHRQWRGMNRSHIESYKPLSNLASSSWKTEHDVSHVERRRDQSVEELDQHSSISPQALLLKNSLSSTSEEVNPIRHMLHAPVPCRPQPIKSSPLNLPWSSAPGTNLVVQSSVKPNLLRFPNLITSSQHGIPQRQGFGSLWQKQSTPEPISTEPTVLFRVRSLSEHGKMENVESQTKPQEKTVIPLSRPERISEDGLREVCEGPLDLSDQGKSKSSSSPREYPPSSLKGVQTGNNSPNKDGKTSTYGPESSPHFVNPSSSSFTAKQKEEEPASNQKHKVIKQQEQKEEVNGKMDQSIEKKVPVLTISLRPVVVLETLNTAHHQQELSSNDKSSSPAVETGSSTDEQDEDGNVSGQESSLGCKRKRASVETETDRDSDTDDIQQQRKINSTVRTEEKSPTALK